jgi:glycosyltransferase involved in cell wall biosynthesis
VTRRRIVLVEFSPSGGLYQFAFQLGRALGQRGHDVELVTGPDPELVDDRGVLRVLPILPTWHPGAGVEAEAVRRARRVVRGARYVAACAAVAQHIRRHRPDVVQWAEWRFSVDGLVAGLVAARHWATVSGDLAHSPLPLREQRAGTSLYKTGPVMSAGLRFGYQRMDCVFVLGDASRNELVQAWPGISRVEVVPHGPWAVQATADVPPPSAAPPSVLFFGSITGYKGLNVLVDAFSLLRHRVPEAELVIAGPVVADFDYAALARRAQETEGIDLRPGYVPLADVPALVAGARLVVAPYVRANASGVVSVAQAFGRPLVVTDVGDLASSVVDGETGAVVPPSDPDALCASMAALLSDPARCDRMGALAREAMRGEASWDAIAARVERAYEACLDGRGRR